MIINGKNHKYYGLIPVSLEGVLDMPSRAGELVYNWGDEIQPLVDAQDIFWTARQFRLKALFDKRVTALDYKGGVNEIANISGFFGLSSDLGSFSVKMIEANKKRQYGADFAEWELLFEEEAALFNGATPSSNGGGSITIDGHSLFNDLRILVKGVSLLDDIPRLNPSSITTSSPVPPYLNSRGLGRIKIDAAILRAGDYVNRLESLKKVLSKPGLRSVNYKGNSYSCFLTEGFNANIKKGLVSFSIVLNKI